ncbi:unnamed protein product [Fusarium graminearum]|uniref:Uncharacterized protein n=1 Tax=Gibberella zeae TaxID=5518 RepID=A0A4U9EP17_GIBZA|nr:unnamed protein product [Fusarium graminearum]CAF3475578.1 unnamed protein product [Fusarium graminearum]CAF3638455.1 unnamed protein product [Fusarium graminearum]CAG1975256.1 unnamed protein product [Fusarium graminearum]CAG1996155.1 unnamed protein product [Fusarium graminearum]
MFLDVKDEIVEVGSFASSLKLYVFQKRPYQNHCTDCQNHRKIRPTAREEQNNGRGRLRRRNILRFSSPRLAITYNGFFLPVV